MTMRCGDRSTFLVICVDRGLVLVLVWTLVLGHWCSVISACPVVVLSDSAVAVVCTVWTRTWSLEPSGAGVG